MLLSSRLWFTAIIATLALLIGVGVPPDAAMAVSRAEVSSAGTSPADAPALPSVDETADAPALPSGSFAIPDAPAPIEQPEHAVAVESPPVSDAVAAWENRTVPTSGLRPLDTTEDTTSWTSRSGSTVTRVSSEPERARADDGEWVDVNTAVSREGDTWTVKDHPLEPVFHGGEDEAPAVTVSRDGHDVSFALVADGGSGR